MLIKNKRAFTLIEIIIVLCLIGLIIGLAQPAFNKIVQRVRVMQIKSDSITIKKSLNLERTGDKESYREHISKESKDIDDLADHIYLNGKAVGKDKLETQIYLLDKDYVRDQTKTKLKGNFYLYSNFQDKEAIFQVLYEDSQKEEEYQAQEQEEKNQPSKPSGGLGYDNSYNWNSKEKE